MKHAIYTSHDPSTRGQVIFDFDSINGHSLFTRFRLEFPLILDVSHYRCSELLVLFIAALGTDGKLTALYIPLTM